MGTPNSGVCQVIKPDFVLGFEWPYLILVPVTAQILLRVLRKCLPHFGMVIKAVSLIMGLRLRLIGFVGCWFCTSSHRPRHVHNALLE